MAGAHSGIVALAAAVLAVLLQPAAVLGQVAASSTASPEANSSSTTDFGVRAKPLNKRWVMTDLCQFGSLPGMFVEDMPTVVADVSVLSSPGSTFLPGRSWLPYGTDFDTANYGGRWKLLHPTCWLRNLIKPVLDFSAPTPPAEAMKVLLISDTQDAHLLQWIGEHHHRKFGAESEQAQRLNYSMQFNDGTSGELSHVSSTSGLLLFHMYLPTLDPSMHAPLQPSTADNSSSAAREEVHLNPSVRVLNSRARFDSIMKAVTGEASRSFDPDLVLLHCNFMALYRQYLADKATSSKAPFMLPPEYVRGYITNLTEVAMAARQAFPRSLLMMRTASMVRHDYVTGAVKDQDNVQWAYRMHFAQLNQGLRQVAQALWLPVLDEETLVSGLTPIQASLDDSTLNEAVSWEVVNLLMNHVKQYKDELAVWRRARTRARAVARRRRSSAKR